MADGDWFIATLQQAAAEGLNFGGNSSGEYFQGTGSIHSQPTITSRSTSYAGTTSSGGRGASGRGYGGRGSGRGYFVRADETHKAADTLNLDEFLAESNAAEIRKLGSGKL